MGRVADEFLEPSRSRGKAKVVGGGVLEAVSLVENHGLVRRDDRAVSRFADGEISQVEVMVDDDQVGRGRLAPGARQEAVVEVRALPPPTGVAGNVHPLPQGRRVGKILELGPVARRGRSPPSREMGRFGPEPVGRLLLRLLETPQAEIVRLPLQPGRADRLRKKRNKSGKVFLEDLVLESLGAGGHDRLEPGEKDGQEVSERLARPRPRLGQKDPSLAQSRFDRGRHLGLAGPLLEPRKGLRQGAVRREPAGGRLGVLGLHP